ncbi:MAG: serine/threonine-protein kinase [Aquabacterium sp.]|nr:serine/threonine-protein kinase [Aquabacterium sp.]
MFWFSSKRASPDQPASAAAHRQLLSNRYQLGSRLGEGGGSQVLEATDLRTGQQVAVKLIQLPADLPASQRQEWTQRLHREAELARKLDHPDIVAVYEAGLQGQHAWLVMERIRGADLSRYTQRHLLLPENLVLHIGARVAAALAHAHAQGVVHRDLKPANVLVNLATGLVKLADFGVARTDDAAQTRTGLTLGTPAYMAPEQLAGAPASAATDTYALGVMLFELLAGRRPHQAATLGELLQATANQPPAALARLRPDLPAPAVAAVEQLLARRPADRPAQLDAWAGSVAALAAVMTRLLAPSSATSL